MPTKGRIDEEAFQKALRSLRIDEIALLDNSKSTADMWGQVCIRMGKADNLENRRACYDMWKRKRYKSQDIVNNMLQNVKQLTNNTTTRTNILQAGRVHEIETNAAHDVIQTISSELTTDIATQNNNEIKEVSYPSLQAATTTNQHFIEQLQGFLNQQQKNISLIYTHDLNSTCCSGDIDAIQILCKCRKLSDNIHTSEKNSLNTHLSHDVHAQYFGDEKSSSNDTHDPQLVLIRSNIQDSQNEDIVTSNNSFINNENVTMSLVHTPPQLLMSPTSSSSAVYSPKGANVTSTPKETNKLKPVSRLFKKAKNMLSPAKPVDHTIIDDEQQKVLTFLQRQTENSSMFTCKVEEIQQVERTKSIVVSQIHMDELKEFHKDDLKKNNKKNKKNKRTHLDDDSNEENQKRNLEWTVIFDGYVQHSNDYCVFIYDGHYFTSRTAIGNSNQFFMSVDAHCKFSTCSCQYHAILNENGRLKINYFGNIAHKIGEVHGRPYRGSRRQKLQQFTILGTTPGALHLQQLKLMSSDNKKAGNRNVVGSSPSVIRKISSEANVKLRRDDDIDKSLRELKTEQAKKIFPAEQVPGYLQEISMDPLRLICFTAGGLYTYHQLALNMPLSWDATGGIVINRNKRIYYYELTMSNLIKGGPSFPVTVMLSESHGTMDIVHWMNCFIEKYKQAYGFSNPFPKPPIIHSDRALVFLLAGIQIFNNDETMNNYIERCWRIVQRKASKRDLEITIVHACLGHFMKNVRRNASKDLGKKQVPFGMWLMALMVNSSTLEELIIVWRNICIILISPNQNDQFKMSLSTLSKMAEEMNANPDKTNFVLKNVLVTSKGQFTSSLATETDEDDMNDLVFGEEEAVLYMESSFKELFTTILRQSKESIKTYDAPQWENLPDNPLFSAAYLTRLLKLYMPTVPIWSNLLLGDFAFRYGYKSDSVMQPCSCHFGRTTGVSESHIRVLKEAILHDKVYTRIDEVVSILGETIEAVEIQFADYVSIKKTKSRLLPDKKQKQAEEQWNKRKKTARTTGVYTSEKPPMNLVAMMNTQLLGKNDDSNLDVGQLPQFLRFENKSSNCWLNSMLQMILASGHIVEAILNVDNITADDAPANVGVIGNLLHTLVKKHKLSSEEMRTIVKQSYISDHIGYLRWAGMDIHPGKFNCVFDFFQSGIVPTLEFYNIDFNFVIDISINCSSCKKVNTIDRQTWDCLLVGEASVQDSLDNIMVNLFGATLQRKVCPECANDAHHYTSLSIRNCPKNLFIRFNPTTATGHQKHKLSSHVDFAKIISNNIIYTRSYSRYTLQSFITFNGKDDDGHYVTFARRKADWYRLDDMNITTMRPSSLFGQQADLQPVVLAHFTRPSNIDIFSTALWNVFTNFSHCNSKLQPTLCLNDAATYFAKCKLIENNPLNLAVAKRFECQSCRKGLTNLLPKILMSICSKFFDAQQ